jgi:hypothetical protein
MAAKDEVKGAAELPKFVRPDTSKGLNLNARYPLYDGGDGQNAKEGTKGHGIHGYILGIVDLPSKQLDENGDPKPWPVMIIELKQAAPACDSGEDAVTTMRPAGTKIGFTMTTALTSNPRFARLARDPNFVHEIFIEPVMGRNAKKQALWLYPEFTAIGKIKRDKIMHSVNVEAYLDDLLGAAPQLPSTNGAPFKAPELAGGV